jgi:preprotein translocase subunit YajC
MSLPTFTLIQSAHAQTTSTTTQTTVAAPAASGNSTEATLMSFLPMVLLFVLMYFLMIRPQIKKGKEQKNMIEALKKGDEVVALGGVLGKIHKISESYVTLELPQDGKEVGVQITIQKNAIQLLLPKDTLKSL